jgi:hypothetical protein
MNIEEKERKIFDKILEDMDCLDNWEFKSSCDFHCKNKLWNICKTLGGEYTRGGKYMVIYTPKLFTYCVINIPKEKRKIFIKKFNLLSKRSIRVEEKKKIIGYKNLIENIYNNVFNVFEK